MSPPPREANNPGVLMVGNFLSRHGANRSVGEELARRLEEGGWTVLTTSSRRLRPLRLADMVLTALRHRHAYDIAQIDVFSGAAFRWAEAVATTLDSLRKPFVLTLHGGRLPDFARRHPRRVERLLTRAAAVTAPSPYLAQALRPWRDDLLLLPNPLDIRRYPFRHRGPLAPRIVWLRAFHRTYRPQLAPAILAALAPQYPDLHLEMIGPDKGDGSLEATRHRARELGVEQRLTIVPGIAKSEVPGRLAAADIFLNTTAADNTPVSVLEALACGLCVVSTDAGGLPHLLHHGDDALLAPVEDATGLAEAVARLLVDGDLAARLSAAGRAKVESFDWSLVLPRWHRLLRDVAHRDTTAASASRAAGDVP